MTDTHESHLGADNAQAIDREPVELSTFTNLDATLDSDALAQALMAETPERVASTLSQWRGHLNHYAENVKRLERQRRHAVDEKEAIETLRQRDLTRLEDKYAETHSGTTFTTTDTEVWTPWLEAIVVAGIRAGHASEVHSLMLALNNFGEAPRGAWEHISPGLRLDSGQFPDPLTPATAIARAHQHYLRTAGYINGYHPADPRLGAGWQEIWSTAKRRGLCDVWDEMARTMGIPQQDTPTRGGTVIVTGTFSISLEVSGVEDGETPDIEWDEIAEAIGNAPRHALDIDEIDDSDLEYE